MLLPIRFPFSLRRRSPLWGASLRLIVFLFIVFILMPQRNLFEMPYSTVLEEEGGKLLSARISDEGQWIFPPVREVPDNFEKAILTFEDKRFYRHGGVDLLSLARAIYENLKAGTVTSGASTLSMQVIRLSRRGQPRTISEKLKEMILAFKMEIHYSKKEILSLYSCHAPFGGNVIGLEAASWRYYGRRPDNLSWAEASALAVLPNSPSLIYPGKNSPILKKKRDTLLFKLLQRGYLSKDQYQLSLQETLPGKPKPLPDIAPHLIETAISKGEKGRRVISTLDISLQKNANTVVQSYSEFYSQKGAKNACAIIMEVNSGKVLAYIGNSKNSQISGAGYYDMIQVRRSTGSILKPFLFTSAMEQGQLLPNQLLPDYPVFFEGFTPKNMSHKYDGAVAANEALIRSLNIPFVFMLKEYGYEKFHNQLEAIGIPLQYSASHYGLTLILGGAESSLWDLTSSYASLGRVLNQYNKTKNYSSSDYHSALYLSEEVHLQQRDHIQSRGRLSASNIYNTLEILTDLVRPGDEVQWERFASGNKISWKTGTSFGARDGWAIGMNSKYLVGVWIGNADCTGISEFVASRYAGAVLFDLFPLVPKSPWFGKPHQDMKEVEVCRQSGMLVSPDCEESKIILVSDSDSINQNICPYHKTLHLDSDQKQIVDSSVYPVSKMIHKKWFILPPVQEHYYRKKDLSYRCPPLKHPDLVSKNDSLMQFIYPNNHTRIYVPIELDGSVGEVIFHLAHSFPDTTVFWHLDNQYIGKTRSIHQLGIYPPSGEHVLHVVDENGNSLSRHIEVIPNAHGTARK